MNRMYFGLTHYNADGSEKEPESIQVRHARETAEMEQRLDEAITVLIHVVKDGSSSQAVTTARRDLREAIAESTALELEHLYEWRR
jgi:hypothetical protein